MSLSSPWRRFGRLAERRRLVPLLPAVRVSYKPRIYTRPRIVLRREDRPADPATDRFERDHADRASASHSVSAPSFTTTRVTDSIEPIAAGRGSNAAQGVVSWIGSNRHGVANKCIAFSTPTATSAGHGLQLDQVFLPTPARLSWLCCNARGPVRGWASRSLATLAHHRHTRCESGGTLAASPVASASDAGVE